MLASESASALGVVAGTAEELADQLAAEPHGAPPLVLDGFERFSTTPARSGSCSPRSRA